MCADSDKDQNCFTARLGVLSALLGNNRPYVSNVLGTMLTLFQQLLYFNDRCVDSGYVRRHHKRVVS